MPARAAVALAATVMAAATLTGCDPFLSSSPARGWLADQVETIQNWAWPLRHALLGDPEATLATADDWMQDLRPSRHDGEGLSGYVLAVSGGGGEETRIEFAVTASGETGNGFFAQQWQAISCFTLRIDASGEAIHRDDADCAVRDGDSDLGAASVAGQGVERVPASALGVPGTLDASTMPADPPEALAGTARERVLAALAEETTVSAIEARLRTQLTQSNILIAVEEQDGEIAAAVGAAGTQDCALAVRHRDGTVDEPDFDRVQLSPGETGCSPDLYFRPAQ